MNIHQKMFILIVKTMKAYSKMMILSVKNYEDILKFNFLNYLIQTYWLFRHVLYRNKGVVIYDYLGKYFEAAIYRNEGVVIYRYTKNNPLKSTLRSVNSFSANLWKISYIYANLVVSFL